MEVFYSISLGFIAGIALTILIITCLVWCKTLLQHMAAYQKYRKTRNISFSAGQTWANDRVLTILRIMTGDESVYVFGADTICVRILTTRSGILNVLPSATSLREYIKKHRLYLKEGV